MADDMQPRLGPDQESNAGVSEGGLEPVRHDGRPERGGKGPSRLTLFLKAALPDFVLALIAAVAIVFTVSYAFESAPDLRGDLLVCAGLAAPMLAILYAGSWSKRAAVFSAVGAVAYAVAVLAGLAAQMPADVALVADGQVNDVAENPVVFGLVALVVPVAVFLLSRRKSGIVVLFVATVVACGLVQFLYRDWSTAEPGTIAALVAIFAVGAQFVYQGYRSSVYAARSVSRTSFGGAAAFAALIVGACVVFGCVVFYGAIEPLGLPTPVIKPFQDLYSRPVLEYRSPYTQQQVEDPDQTTDQTNEDMLESSEDAEGGEEGQTADEQQDWSGSPISALIENSQAFDPDNWNQMFQAINYQALAVGAIVFALVAAALIAVAIALRRWQRSRRLEKLRGQPREYGVWFLYGFITKRLERLGFVRPETFTPLEFAMASRNALAPFTRNTGGVDYLQLTLIYQRACYAPETLTASDEADIVRYYRAFFDNARQFVGLRRWLVKFWRI